MFFAKKNYNFGFLTPPTQKKGLETKPTAFGGQQDSLKNSTLNSSNHPHPRGNVKTQVSDGLTGIPQSNCKSEINSSFEPKSMIFLKNCVLIGFFCGIDRIHQKNESNKNLENLTLTYFFFGQVQVLSTQIYTLRVHFTASL